MLLFWSGDAADVASAKFRLYLKNQASGRQAVPPPADIPSLDASIAKLDALKSELKQQYAQFGKDQSALNSKCLGSWHRTRDSNGHEK